MDITFMENNLKVHKLFCGQKNSTLKYLTLFVIQADWCKCDQCKSCYQ